MADPSFSGRTAIFSQWSKALPGATFSDSIEIVDLRSRNAGRGIDATLFTIPRKAVISVEMSELRQRIPQLFESRGDGDDEQELDSWSALILVLMYEFLLGPSAWKPYLDMLPETFDTPMFWSDDELSELQASAVLAKVGKAEAEDTFRAKLLPAIRSHPDMFRSSADYSDDGLMQAGPQDGQHHHGVRFRSRD